MVNAYSYRNAGDAAIMIATRDLLVDLGATSVKISSRYSDSDDYARHDISVLPAIIPFPERGAAPEIVRLFRLIVSAAGALLVVAISSFSRRVAGQTSRIFTPAAAKVFTGDVVGAVIAGGGYMYSSKRAVNLSLWHSLLTIRLSSALASETIMMPQSIGPVHTKFDARLMQWALRDVSVVVRERISLAKSTAVPQFRSGVSEVPDVAFYRRPGEVEQGSDRRKIVRLVAMDWTWSTSVSAGRFETYVANLAVLCDKLTETGWLVVVGGHSSIPEHDQDDLLVAERVASLCLNPPEVDHDSSVEHLRDAYASASLTIGTRLHACIMSIAAGTPAIALAYQEKARGVLADAGLAEFVHSVDDFDPDVVVAQATELYGRRLDEVAASLRNRIVSAYEEVGN
jgi:colanic acid/amylovoran biosynthesis protein